MSRASLPRTAALIAGVGALSCAHEPEIAAEDVTAGEGRPPPVVVEIPPKPAPGEPFAVLRELGVEVWIAEDRRLGVRVHEAASFEPALQLLAELDHELESLDLAYLPIDELWPLMYVRSTERLDLSGARADLRPLRHLGRLRELSLAATDYASLAPLAELDTLERLDLSSAQANLIAVGQLDALRELQLGLARTTPRGFEVRDGEGLDLAALRGLGGLEILGLRRTKVRSWTPLAELWTVRRLDLSYTNFSDLGLLERFAELESLSLRRTAVADLGPLLLLGGLRHVDLRDCELVDELELDRVRQLRPELEMVF